MTADTSPSSRVERLAGLCRIWGAAKFFHPYLAYRDIDWDAALVAAIPIVSGATSAEDYAKGVGHLLAYLDDPATRVVDDEEDAAALFSSEVFEGRPALLWRGGTAALQAAQLTGFSPGLDLMDGIKKLLTEMETAEALVVDLRKTGSYFVMMQLESFAPLFLDGVAFQPSTRKRMHSGYTTDGSGSGGYNSGFYVTDSLPLIGTGGPLASKPLAFILDSTVGAPDWVTALQSAGRARVIFVGDPDSVGPGEQIELPEGVRVSLRTGEHIFSDGSLGFAADVTLSIDEPEGEYLDTPALVAASAALQGNCDNRARRTVEAPVTRYRREKRYEDKPFPSLEHRLLALFRYWTVMDLFFPYHQHLDRPWDEALVDGIPLLEAAADETEYVLALAAVNAKASDTHCFLSSAAFHRWRGTHIPPMIVRLVEGRTAITHLAQPIDGLAVGDVVLSVDGEATESRRDRARPYYSASTPQAMEWRLHDSLLRGEEGSEAVLELERADGSAAKVTVGRDQAWVAPAVRDLPVFGVLPSGIGYMDLARLMPHQVDEAFEAVRDTPALVLDDRCYPNGTAWAIAARLADGEFVGALFRRPEPRSPSRDTTTELKMKQTLPASDKWRYKQPVAVLINGEAISQAEHTCLLIDAACKPTFVGSATNGANGDVTSIQLPGGVTTMFSGHDVRHADGRQLQRVGIQPHVEVHPTIAGIREGRDEVLEAAVDLLARNSEPKGATPS